MNNWKGLKPAFFYGRISTDNQDKKLSIGEQKQRVDVMTPKEGYKITRDFEEVKSASTDKRPVFQEMMRLATSPEHPVDAIFFNDLSQGLPRRRGFLHPPANLQGSGRGDIHR